MVFVAKKKVNKSLRWEVRHPEIEHNAYNIVLVFYKFNKSSTRNMNNFENISDQLSAKNLQNVLNVRFLNL
jgi:hypothetical protein